MGIPVALVEVLKQSVNLWVKGLFQGVYSGSHVGKSCLFQCVKYNTYLCQL